MKDYSSTECPESCAGCNHEADCIIANSDEPALQVSEIESLRQQLAECEETNGKLWEELDLYSNGASGALALPNDATCLNKLIAERTKELSLENFTQHQHIMGLQGKNAELTAQRDAAMKDAERYRWLRFEHAINDPMAAVVWKRNYDRKESEWVNTSDIHSLDRAIDAAIAKGKEQMDE